MTTRPVTPVRSRRVRRALPRLVAATTATVLVTGVALAAPAQAADPAVGVQAVAQTNFDGGSSCPIVAGGNKSANKIVTVPTTGTKGVSVGAGGSATVANTGDATDTATMKVANSVTGSITGAGGAFSKAAFTIKQAGTIGLSKGFETGCSPTIQMTGAFLMQLVVKKAGKLRVDVDVPRHTSVTMQMGRNATVVAIDVSYDLRGTHSVVRNVKPGLYQLVVETQSEFGFAMPDLALSRSGVTTFKAAYTRS